ncbi:MAG: bifunctional methylenetetrahydrofolate dehydrogenase/methenyltetrahydrofolate cyclohydrolase FolD [Betaproteobacteria bacterium]|nr:bifunctional methylenetetrahydrofolate dehydrogenase/methenyltetrahydrofolate cyclohydrolase FolD [Betaproteobacteria bacterium]
MSAQIIDGKALAATVQSECATRAQTLRARGLTPSLAVVIVGEDPASQVYVRNKIRACEAAGIISTHHCLAADTSEGELLRVIEDLNRAAPVHGILVQLPLPKHINSHKVLEAIAPEKDVDGFHRENAGLLAQGNPRLVPCTPAGVMRMLASIGVSPWAQHAVIVGASNIVGKPMALLLLRAGATVTICNSKTRDLAHHTRQADILVAAVGKPKYLNGEMVKPGAVVIDVGINRGSDGKLVGDVDFESARTVAAHITPVPGGVGPMTIAMLLSNTLDAAAATLGDSSGAQRS